MIRYDGKKITPKNLARELISDAIMSAIEFWGEAHGVDFDAMSQREQNLVSEQMENIADRLLKRLGYRK